MTPDSLVEQATSTSEIADLFTRYAVAIADASLTAQSADGRYVDAYTAGFLLAKIVIRAAGYRVKGGDNHRDTLAALPWLVGSEVQSSVDALDAARRKRNADMYDGAGLVDESDVDALMARVAVFEQLVRAWLATTIPNSSDSLRTLPRRSNASAQRP